MTATFPLDSERNRHNVIDYIERQPLDAGLEVIIGVVEKRKTIRQLGGLFGAWAKYVSEQTGYTIDELHAEWKRQWLCRIYAEDPHGKAQKAWVDTLLHLQERQDWDGVRLHARLCSLSWATVAQMREYMSRIEQHYISAQMPLPVLDKFRDVWS